MEEAHTLIYSRTVTHLGDKLIRRQSNLTALKGDEGSDREAVSGGGGGGGGAGGKQGGGGGG